MNSITNASLSQSFSNAVEALVDGISVFLPQLLAASLVILLGIALSAWAKKLVISLISSINFEKYFKDPKYKTLISQTSGKFQISILIGDLVRWLILLLVFIASANILGLDAISDFLMRVVYFIPKLFSALVIITIGVLLAGFVENLIKGFSGIMDPASARLLAKSSSYAIIILTILVALSEIGIATEFIQALYIGIIFMTALGIGLAFGLGSKDIVRKFLEDRFEINSTPPKLTKK